MLDSGVSVLNEYRSTISPKINSPADWYSLKTDLYNGNILMLKGYTEMYIGSMYWKGLYSRNLTPDSSFDELDEWIRSNM